MKRLSGLLTGVLVAGASWAFTTEVVLAQEKGKGEKPKTVPAQEKAKVGQTATKVLLENDKVRVVETRAKPGEKNEMKARPDRVTYHFNAGKQRVHYPDGKTEDLEFKADSVLFRKAGTSSTENTGKTETRNLIINLK